MQEHRSLMLAAALYRWRRNLTLSHEQAKVIARYALRRLA